MQDGGEEGDFVFRYVYCSPLPKKTKKQPSLCLGNLGKHSTLLSDVGFPRATKSPQRDI